jgi:hypothetical protein
MLGNNLDFFYLRIVYNINLLGEATEMFGKIHNLNLTLLNFRITAPKSWLINTPAFTCCGNSQYSGLNLENSHLPTRPLISALLVDIPIENNSSWEGIL